MSHTTTCLRRTSNSLLVGTVTLLNPKSVQLRKQLLRDFLREACIHFPPLNAIYRLFQVGALWQ